MINLALNSNNDLFIVNGNFALVDDAAEVLQSVRSRLLFYMGEWFLDNQIGVPYHQEIFTKPANLGRVESILKGVILGTSGVKSLTDFSMEFNDPRTRALTVTFTAETIYGSIDSEEVSINA